MNTLTMTVQLFLMLLLILSGVNSLLTQAVKGMLDESGKKYRSNILALIDSIIVAVIGMIVYYILAGMKVGLPEITFIFLMAVAVWFVSMYGYDKVKQLILQSSQLRGPDPDNKE